MRSGKSRDEPAIGCQRMIRRRKKTCAREGRTNDSWLDRVRKEARDLPSSSGTKQDRSTRRSSARNRKLLSATREKKRERAPSKAMRRRLSSDRSTCSSKKSTHLLEKFLQPLQLYFTSSYTHSNQARSHTSFPHLLTELIPPYSVELPCSIPTDLPSSSS